ncbi:RES family NAD+ phosphorylase [Rhodococcus sp. NPDC058521]|uniref:RES family NAD+ phosphorylase n=1 Tax=Rhodococcus sp. NPDC058521 TaxID=3346536 RepID=UPI00366102F9
MTSNAAIGFGVTAEIFTTIDYNLTQSWATALCEAGYDGIRYWARHEVARTAACVALFDLGGEPGDDAGHLVHKTENLIECAQLWENLRDQTGVEVVDIPGSL